MLKINPLLRDIYSTNGFHAIIVISILLFEKITPIKIPFKILRKILLQGIYHCEIHPDSFSNEALTTLRLPHPYNIIIHKTARIGTNCTIFHEVTIGMIEKKTCTTAPQISNHVYIGAKSSILGEIKIAEKTKIGAHTLVLASTNIGDTVLGIYK